MDSKIYAKLLLIGTGFDPNIVDQFIGLEGTRIWKKGDKIGRTTMLRKDDGWCLAMPPVVGYDVELAITQLMDYILPRRNEIIGIAYKYELKKEVACTVYTVATMPAINFQPETLKRIYEDDMSLDIDIVRTTEVQ